MKTSSLTLLASLFVSVFGFSQSNTGLTIEYNLYNDEIVYKRNDIEISSPYVKKDENIKLVIIEFNPYITKAEVEVKNINYNQSSSSIDEDGFTYQGGGGFSGLGSLLGGLTMGADAGSQYGGIPSSRGASSREIREAKSQFNQLIGQLKDIESDINNSQEKIELFQNSERSKHLALSDISKLKINPNIKPSRIRELIEEEIRYAFAKRSGETITIDDIIDQAKKEEEIKNTISKYQIAQEEYKSLSKKWNKFSWGLSIFSDDIEDDQMRYIQLVADSIATAMIDNVNNKVSPVFSKDFNYFDSKKNQQSMTELRRVNEELQNNNFTYSFPPIQAVGDEMILDISFTRKNEDGEYEDFKNLRQRIQVSGGWKISGGLGLSFGFFNDESLDYSIVNGTIVADKNDEFIPAVVSFAHFYRQSTKSVNVGGSFGIGLPLLGGNSIQSASFFLGPTLLIGQKQRLLLTVGAMGAKVERLAGGFEPGDNFDTLTDILPIKQNYELGWFIGISYNVIQ